MFPTHNQSKATKMTSEASMSRPFHSPDKTVASQNITLGERNRVPSSHIGRVQANKPWFPLSRLHHLESQNHRLEDL